MAAATVLSGASFGAALVAAGVYQPSVIIGQLKLENWHMMQSFLTAAASSTLIVAALGRLGHIPLKPRAPSSLGFLTRYDGNILGGALLGAGMALSGTCPGTVFAQVALGIRSGFHALDGAIIGGIAYIGFVGPWAARRAARLCPPTAPVSVHERAGISRSTAAAGFVAVAAAIIAATALFTPESPYARISPIVGGLLIALTQLVSALSRSMLIGTSTSFEEVGKYFWWGVKGAGSSARPQSYANLLFAGGFIAGAYALAQAVPSLVAPVDIVVPPALATLGGFIMVVGSRIAGGCTSGHGISGISLLSISSFVTIGVAMTAGFALAPLVH